jgi:UDP-2,4-diacetamido-2,4,6-trideoxy-beta-L-altropyranose hydrolase
MPDIPPLCIRADAGRTIGIGHLMRCLALAQAWQERGGRVCLIAALDAPALLERLRQDQVDYLPATGQSGGEADLRHTIATARELGAEWVVLDGYHFTREFMLQIQAAGLHVLLIDDLADRDLSDIQAVLNQNAYATESMHAGFHRIPRLLLGTGYTLIRREFRQARGEKRIAAEARNILVTMGGADVPNATLQVLRALAQIRHRRLHLRAVIGAANPHVPALEAALPHLREQHEIELLVNPPDMPALMNWSDVTITAAGSSCWELCCLGVPMVMLVTAENQRLMPGYFAKHDIAEVFGELSEERLAEFALFIDQLLGNAARREQLSKAAALVIDGEGAQRAAGFLLGRS